VEALILAETEVTKRVRTEQALFKSSRILAAINHAQDLHNPYAESEEILDTLLAEVIDLVVSRKKTISGKENLEELLPEVLKNNGDVLIVDDASTDGTPEWIDVDGDTTPDPCPNGVWDNAIFAGQGAAGNLINGNVAIRGSVHIVGDPNNPPTVSFSGTADIRNNYAAAAAEFGAIDAAKLPALPPVEFNGETVESLSATVRLEHGTITMDGTSDIGEADAPGNGYKETVDAIRADGTVGPDGQVHADDWGDYDATGVEFPTLDDPYVDRSNGSYWNTHREFLETNSLLIPEVEISADVDAFSYTDGTNSISWDPITGNLDIAGIVRVNRDLRFGKGHGRANYLDVHYAGTGTIYVPNDLEIDAAVVPAGNYLTDGNLGLIAGERVEIDKLSNINVIAAIYAQDAVKISKQTAIGGAVVSNYFDLGTNVPSIYQVPGLSTQLPPGMPGGMRLAVIDGASVINWFQER